MFVVTQSCEKEGREEINRIDDNKEHQKEVIQAQKEFGEEFLVMIKQNPKVKELLIESCQQQKYGDYYVRTQDFLNQLSNDFPMNAQLASSFKRLTELKKKPTQ